MIEGVVLRLQVLWRGLGRSEDLLSANSQNLQTCAALKRQLTLLSNLSNR